MKNIRTILRSTVKSQENCSRFLPIRRLRGGPNRKANLFDVNENNQPPIKRIRPPKDETCHLLEDATNFVDLQSPAMLEDRWTSDLYPKEALNRRRSSLETFMPPSLRPDETTVVLFPGQGSQYVGMGAELLKRQVPDVKRLFEVASHVLRYDLEKMCLEGPSVQLNRTANAHAAIFVSSLAAVERLKHENPKAVENCIATAGFSVGEYAALVFAGSLSFEDALNMVKLRSEAMQRASELSPSGLLTVFENYKSKLSLAITAAKQWIKEQKGYEPVCSVANYLFVECKVLGGEEEALRFIEENASKFNLTCKRLPVSGAFHTALMRPAADEFRQEIVKFKLLPPLINVHSNLDGKPYSKRNAGEIARKLVKQIYLPVRWEQTMHVVYDTNFFVDKFPKTFECGPGKHLGFMLKRTHARAYLNYRSYFEDFSQDGQRKD